MKQFEKFSEAELIKKILEGERNLYEIIVRRHNSYLYKIGRSYNYNHEDTQDLMQDTYIDAFKNLAQFEQKASFKTWLIRIMLNNCFRKKEKFSFKNEFAQDEIHENLTPMFSSSNNDITKILHNKELKTIIEEALAKIPEDYRMVFSLREINGMNVAETSTLLNISEENVKVRLNRAKTMLKKTIKTNYSATEIFDFTLTYCNPLTEKVMKKIYEL